LTNPWRAFFTARMKNLRMRLAAVCPILLFAGAASSAHADESTFWLGVHNFSVPDVNSDTYGITGGGRVDKHTGSGTHYFGSVDLFADRDEDDLDPDHIPFRWDVHLGTAGNLWKGARTHIDWTANVDTRMNTVSSVEREITALPAIVARYEGNIIQPSIKAGAGWFFLEIDDDVPKTRGYDRSDFRNSTLGYTVAADLRIRMGDCCKLDVMTQGWRDDHDWLQNQYGGALHVDAGGFREGSEVVLSADAYEYNLDVYQRPGEPAILPWKNDLLVRLIFKVAR
jgi:hypothetical protein